MKTKARKRENLPSSDLHLSLSSRIFLSMARWIDGSTFQWWNSMPPACTMLVRAYATRALMAEFMPSTVKLSSSAVLKPDGCWGRNCSASFRGNMERTCSKEELARHQLDAMNCSCNTEALTEREKRVVECQMRTIAGRPFKIIEINNIKSIQDHG